MFPSAVSNGSETVVQACAKRRDGPRICKNRLGISIELDDEATIKFDGGVAWVHGT